MTITDQVAKNIIRKLLKGEDYRIEVVTLINTEFLQFALDFFKKVIAMLLFLETLLICNTSSTNSETKRCRNRYNSR